MREWNGFEEDREFVLGKLKEGFLDHLEMVSRVVETEFFRSFLASGGLERLSESYPTPRQKEEVPLWLYLSSQITLRLHAAPGFSSLPYIIHCGGLRHALEEGQMESKEDPLKHTRSLEFKGYNEKNSYRRRTPCDQDFLRKLARDTRPDRLEAWYGTAVARYLGELGAYDSEGIFIADGSYLFVPNNERYEFSRTAYFDEHNHPISREEEAQLAPAARKRCRFRRYYQLVGLTHTNRRRDCLLYAGARVLPGVGQEVQQLLPLVEQFCGAVSSGVMKVLLVDRGFIDGESFGRIKKDYGVDVVVPLKAKMDLTEDAWKLAEVDRRPWQIWKPPEKEKPPEPPQRPEHIRRAEKKRQETVAEKKKAAGLKPPAELLRVELKLIEGMRHWQACPVPLNVVVMREYYTDGEVSQWGLMTTGAVEEPLQLRELYGLRPTCEEGWRQGKCYWDLTGFRSCSFSLVVNHVIFICLSYTLIQVFLLQSERGELAKATRQKLLASLLPEGEKVALYYENRVAYLGVREYSEILLNLAEGARRRLVGTLRRLRKQELEPPALRSRL